MDFDIAIGLYEHGTVNVAFLPFVSCERSFVAIEDRFSGILHVCTSPKRLRLRDKADLTLLQQFYFI